MADTAAATSREPVDLTPYGLEVERGMPNEKPALDAARERLDFYNYDGESWPSRFRRDAESGFDFQGRPHAPSGFLRECVEILTEHLYVPGPTRAWTEAAGEAFLRDVWGSNRLDALMGHADALSTLNDAALVQIDAGRGDPARPITYRLWGREQFAAWPDPDDPTTPIAVCTIDRYDLRTRYRLWSDTEVRTYLTQRADQTAGGQVAYFRPELSGEHGYGCLPFTLCSYDLPIQDLCTVSPGKFAHQAELIIDQFCSALSESVLKHLNPIPVAEGVPTEWRPIVEPMRFIRMPRAGMTVGTKGYEPGEFARLYFLQPQVDTAGAWGHLTQYMNQVFRAARIPIGAALVEEMPGVVSGIALLLVEAPLYKRAKKRRGVFGAYEQDLARRTLICAGNFYGRPDLVAAAAAGKLVTGWPEPTVPVPTTDNLLMLREQVAWGFKSHFQALQQWYGFDHDDAVEFVRRMKADTDLLNQIYPDINASAPDEPDPADLPSRPAAMAADSASRAQ